MVAPESVLALAHRRLCPVEEAQGAGLAPMRQLASLVAAAAAAAAAPWQAAAVLAQAGSLRLLALHAPAVAV